MNADVGTVLWFGVAAAAAPVVVVAAHLADALAAGLAVVAVATIAYLARRVLRLEARVERLAHTRARRRRFRGRPAMIVLVRHGESEGNVDHTAYTRVADPRMPLTARGERQARGAGPRLRALVGPDRAVFAYASPYRRARQTAKLVLSGLDQGRVQALVEDPRLREQEFAGSYQEPPPDEPQNDDDDEEEDEHEHEHEDENTSAFEGGGGARGVSAPPALGGGGGAAALPRKYSSGRIPSLHLPDRSFGALPPTPGGRRRRPYPKFYFRYAGGESAADVYDRVSLFMDSLPVHNSRFVEHYF